MEFIICVISSLPSGSTFSRNRSFSRSSCAAPSHSECIVSDDGDDDDGGDGDDDGDDGGDDDGAIFVIYMLS